MPRRGYRVRFTREAEADLLRLYGHLLDDDVSNAERALDAIERSLELLRLSPYSCRKATTGNPFVRELIIPFGCAGYVALYEIEPRSVVTILAIRHQREDDYH